MRAFEPLHPRLRIGALTVFAAGAINRGVAYFTTADTGGYTTFVDALIPLHVWAAVWVAAGAFMIVGIWHRIIARWALSFGASLWAVWAVSFWLSWIIGDQSRAWVTAGAMATIAGSMWITAALADSAGPIPGPVIHEEDDGGPT